MLKIILIFISFIRELLYNSKDEYNYSSSKFDTSKAVLFIVIVSLVLSSFFFAIRAFKTSKNIVILKEAIITHETNNELRIRTYEKRIEELETIILKEIRSKALIWSQAEVFVPGPATMNRRSELSATRSGIIH